MFADNKNVVREPRQHLSTQVSQAPVTEDGDAIVLADCQLHRDLERRRHRLSKNRDVVGQRVRDGMKISLWDGDVVGKSAVVVQDAKDGSIGAVRGQTHSTRLARPAGAVDFAHNPSPGQRPGLRDTDELVTEHAAESHVAFDQLQIRLAHAGPDDSDEHLAGGWRGCRPARDHIDLIVEDHRTHLLKPITRALVIALGVTLTLVTQSIAQTDVATSPAESDVFGPNEPQRALKSGKVVRAIRIASPPTIDGRLDDEPWIVAPAATDLTQRYPDTDRR